MLNPLNPTIKEDEGVKKYNEALEKSGYTKEEAREYWSKAENNDAYSRASKEISKAANAQAPKVVISNGKIKVTAPQEVLNSAYTQQLKKELQVLKGADLSSKEVQNVVDQLNKEIQTNFTNALVEQTLGWTPEEYADYQYAVQTVSGTNPIKSSNLLSWAVDGERLKDENGNIIMKTPEQWMNYWRENYNTDERTDLLYKSMQSNNPYERTMALVLMQGNDSPVYGFDPWERFQQGLGAAWNQVKKFPEGTFRLMFTDDKTRHIEDILDKYAMDKKLFLDKKISNEEQFNSKKEEIKGKSWDDLTSEQRTFLIYNAVSQDDTPASIRRSLGNNAKMGSQEMHDVDTILRGGKDSVDAINRVIDKSSFDKYKKTRDDYNSWVGYDEDLNKDDERLSKNAIWSATEQTLGSMGGVVARFLWENAVVRGLTGGVGSGGKGGVNMNKISDNIGENLVKWLNTKGIAPTSATGQGLLNFGASLLGTIPEDILQTAVDNVVTYNAKENENLLNPEQMSENFKQNLIWMALFNGAKAGINSVKKARMVNRLKKAANLAQEVDIDGISADADDVARAVKNGDKITTENGEVKIIDADGNEKVLKNTTKEQAEMAQLKLFDEEGNPVKYMNGDGTASPVNIENPKIDADDLGTATAKGEGLEGETPKVEGEAPKNIFEAVKQKIEPTIDNIKAWHAQTLKKVVDELKSHLDEFHDKFGDVRASDFDWVWYQTKQGLSPEQIIGTTDPTTGRVITKNMIDAMQWWSEQPFVKDLRQVSREALNLEGDFDTLGYLPHTDYDPSNLSYEEAMTGALWQSASGKSVLGKNGEYKGFGGDFNSRYTTFASNMLWDARNMDVATAKLVEEAAMDGQEVTQELMQESRKAVEGEKDIRKKVAESPSSKKLVDALSSDKEDIDWEQIDKDIKDQAKDSGLGKAYHDNYQNVYQGANTANVTKQRGGFINSFDTLANRMRNTVIGNGMSMYDWGGADIVYAMKNAVDVVSRYMTEGGDLRKMLTEYVMNHSHRSEKYATQVVDKWMNKLGEAKAKNGGVLTKGDVIMTLGNSMRSEATSRLKKWLVMADYDSFNSSTQKMIDQFLFDHVQTDAIKTSTTITQKIGKVLDTAASLRYRALFYGNIKNALLQTSELNRYFSNFKWGDVATMAKRLATDEGFRARVDMYVDSVAPDTGILDAELYGKYGNIAESMEVGEDGVTFKSMAGKAKETADAIGLAPIETAEAFKNRMMVAGLVQEADRLGLTGDEALRYIRQRFERVALAADEMGRIGLASNPLARPMLFLNNFQIRELGMHFYNIKDATGMAKSVPMKIFKGATYLSKVFGAKLGTTLLLARLGYPASQALGIDPFGLLGDYNQLDEDEMTWLDKQISGGVLTPFVSGGMTSLFADFYFLARNAYEDSVRQTVSDEAEETMKKDENAFGRLKWPNLTAEQIFGGLAQNFAPGATAFNRINQMNEMMDSGWATSAMGNKMYTKPDDAINTILGYLFGRSATANAQRYNQTYGDNLTQTLGRFNPFRNYQEFDPIDTQKYSDWFDGSANDLQQFKKGLNYFKSKRDEILDAYEKAIRKSYATDADISSAKNDMNRGLNELFDQFENFVDAYEKKNGTVTPWMTKQIVNVLNIGRKNVGDTPDEATARSLEEYEKALGRYSDLGISAVGTYTGPSESDPEKEVKYQGSPQFRSAVNGYYGESDEAVEVLKQADQALSQLRKDLKESLNAAYEAKDYDEVNRIQNEYLKSFDQVVSPIIAMYGNGILGKTDVVNQLKDMLSTGTMSRSGDLIPSDQYKKDKYGRYRSMPYETVDVKKWAQQRFSGDLYKNPTSSSSSTAEDDLAELRKLINSNKPQRAKAKALQIKARVDSQKISISSEDYQWLVNFIKNGGE